MSARPAPALPVDQWPSCDRCPAASLYRVITGVGPLYVCGHHYSRNAGEFARLKFNIEYRYPSN